MSFVPPPCVIVMADYNTHEMRHLHVDVEAVRAFVHLGE